MSSMRQQIIDAFADRLNSIVAGTSVDLPGGSHTYSRTVSPFVYTWRSEPLTVDEVFVIVIRDQAAPKERGEGKAATGQHLHLLLVEVEVLVVEQFPAEALREIVADIVAAVGSDPRFGGLARWTDLESDAMIVRDDVTGGLAAAKLEFIVSYRTALWRS